MFLQGLQITVLRLLQLQQAKKMRRQKTPHFFKSDQIIRLFFPQFPSEAHKPGKSETEK